MNKTHALLGAAAALAASTPGGAAMLSESESIIPRTPKRWRRRGASRSRNTPIPRGVLGAKQQAKMVKRLQNDFKAAERNYKGWCLRSNAAKGLAEELTQES